MSLYDKTYGGVAGREGPGGGGRDGQGAGYVRRMNVPRRGIDRTKSSLAVKEV